MLGAMSGVQRIGLVLVLQFPLGCLYGASVSSFEDYKPLILFFYNGTKSNVQVGLEVSALVASGDSVAGALCKDAIFSTADTSSDSDEDELRVDKLMQEFCHLSEEPAKSNKLWQVVPSGVHVPLGGLKKAETIVVTWQWYGAWLGSSETSELQFNFPLDGELLQAVRLHYGSGKYSATLHPSVPKAHSLEDIFPRVWRSCLRRDQRYNQETAETLTAGLVLYKEKAKDPACARYFLNLPEAKTDADKYHGRSVLDAVVHGKVCAIKAGWLRPIREESKELYATCLTLNAREILEAAYETCKTMLAT